MYQHPIHQELNGEQLQNAGRIITGLIYKFEGKTSKENPNLEK